MISKFYNLLWQHKFITLFLLAVIITSGYFGYQKINQSKSSTSYLTSTAEKGLLISSISGTGQVSSSNQFEIKPKVSGDIISVKVVSGQEVKKDELIAQIDNQEAAVKVNEAQASLENAKLDLQELLAPVDDYTLLQAENDLADARDSLTKLAFEQQKDYQNTLQDKEDAESDLVDTYEDAYNKIADTFLDLPDIMTGLNTILFSEEIADSEVTVQPGLNYAALINGFSANDYIEKDRFESYVESAKDYYNTAKDSYDDNFDSYRDASRYSDKEIIKNLLDETIETTKQVADTVKSEINMLDFWVEYRSDEGFRIYTKVSQYQSDLDTYTSQTNSHLSSLLAIQRSLENAKQAIVDAEVSLAEMDQNQPLDLAAAERNVRIKEKKLADLLAGENELEIKNKELVVRQRQNDLMEAQQNYADYFIRVPFDGIVAEVDLAKGDSVSSGTTIATLITDQKIAEVTLNEIDAAQIEVGQKASLTFDAVSDLSITGEVVEVDTLGIVTSGVVSYDVKIAFDVQDERVKPGMSASVNIITESKSDVLLVPINTVKTMGTGSYVEILVDGQPQRKTVAIGSSSDTMIEIIEGLKEGEEVITQTISNGSTNQTQSSGRNEGPGGMGGMMMIR